jgi:HJR/Mrr/RecB family endonuclease
LLEAEGWDAKQTSKLGGDGGIDIVAIKDKEGLLIQCKRSKKPLGWDAIKEVVAGAAKYQHLYPTISFAKLAVTNHSFNANSKEQAHYNKVQLWERTELAIKLKALRVPFSTIANVSDFMDELV